ncbi:MAG TPA: HDOD domain-containing protein [Gammaproteobacteria bacterium]|nr:HDOD domain-containing protein [Gammaproteobacteria bacterium]
MVFGRLKHWMTGSRTAPTGRGRQQPAATTGTATSVELQDGPLTAEDDDIELAFSGCILGASSITEHGPNAFERRALRELERLTGSRDDLAEQVPRLPSIIPRVMQALRDDDSSAAGLAREIGRDSVLIGEVIRLANSPFYRTGKEVDSLEGAIVRVGRTGIRQLVSRAVFKPLLNLDSGHFTRLSSAALWEQAEKTAVAADCLARREGGDRFHAYLAGIVHNVGFSVAMTVLDRIWDDTDVPRSLEFRSKLSHHARQLTTRITRSWDFPDSVVTAMASYAGIDGDKHAGNGLASILYAADKLAKIHTLSTRGLLGGEEGKRIQCRLQGRLTDSCAACYESLARLDTG